MDVIASTAFGLQVDSQKDPNNSFVKMAEKAFKFNFFRPLVFFLCKWSFLVWHRASYKSLSLECREHVRGF